MMPYEIPFEDQYLEHRREEYDAEIFDDSEEEDYQFLELMEEMNDEARNDVAEWEEYIRQTERKE